MAKMPEIAKDDVLVAMGGPAVKGLKFRIQVSPRNCVGCGLCAADCIGFNIKLEDLVSDYIDKI